LVRSVWFWIAFNAFIIGMLVIDLGLLGRKAHVIHFREAAVRTAIWFTMALCFAFGLYVFMGSEAALTFMTGYLIEESLSVDNIFVMVVIFSYFGVPPAYQHRVLFWGILGALLMRGTFIVVGVWLLNHFHFIIYVFGGLLLLTGLRMAIREEKPFVAEDNRIFRIVRRILPLGSRYDGKKFFTIENGRRVATPLLLVLVLVELTDLVFAVDSIPAIFAVTRDPFLIYTSNVFAILGLRSMYFLLAGVIDRFRFLRYGLAFILSFVGVKMLLSETIHISTELSLVVVAGGLAAAIGASMLVRPSTIVNDNNDNHSGDNHLSTPPNNNKSLDEIRRHG
jgi:tellurite resistance protein TerC